MSEKKTPANMTLSPEARAMLSKLAEIRGLSRSAVVETLIRKAAAKVDR
jgi:uncharacterized protein (DUF1778 family)